MATIQENIAVLKQFIKLQKYNVNPTKVLNNFEIQLLVLEKDSLALHKRRSEDSTGQYTLGLGEIRFWTDSMEYQTKLEKFIENLDNNKNNITTRDIVKAFKKAYPTISSKVDSTVFNAI